MRALNTNRRSSSNSVTGDSIENKENTLTKQHGAADATQPSSISPRSFGDDSNAPTVTISISSGQSGSRKRGPQPKPLGKSQAAGSSAAPSPPKKVTGKRGTSSARVTERPPKRTKTPEMAAEEPAPPAAPIRIEVPALFSKPWPGGPLDNSKPQLATEDGDPNTTYNGGRPNAEGDREAVVEGDAAIWNMLGHFEARYHRLQAECEAWLQEANDVSEAEIERRVKEVEEAYEAFDQACGKVVAELSIQVPPPLLDATAGTPEEATPEVPERPPTPHNFEEGAILETPDVLEELEIPPPVVPSKPARPSRAKLQATVKSSSGARYQNIPRKTPAATSSAASTSNGVPARTIASRPATPRVRIPKSSSIKGDMSTGIIPLDITSAGMPVHHQPFRLRTTLEAGAEEDIPEETRFRLHWRNKEYKECFKMLPENQKFVWLRTPTAIAEYRQKYPIENRHGKGHKAGEDSEDEKDADEKMEAEAELWVCRMRVTVTEDGQIVYLDAPCNKDSRTTCSRLRHLQRTHFARPYKNAGGQPRSRAKTAAKPKAKKAKSTEEDESDYLDEGDEDYKGSSKAKGKGKAPAGAKSRRK